MTLSDEITRRLFVWGIGAIAIIPRQHIDRSAWTIGGGPISHSFRKLLLATVLLHLLRLIGEIAALKRLSDTLNIIQSVSLTFLCFLTPYILQTWLAPRINLPGGRPGADLLPPLYVTAILSISGVALSRLVDRRLWCLNRLGNVITGPPVLRTLKLYNSVTSIGGHHAGRGSVLCQTLVVVEYWHMITQLLCAIAFALEDKDLRPAHYSLWDAILQGCRDIAFASGWTRVLAHSIFINLMDELVLMQSAASSTTSSDSDPTGSSSANDPEAESTVAVTRSTPSPPASAEMVTLVARGSGRNRTDLLTSASDRQS